MRMQCGCQQCIELFYQWAHRGTSEDLIRYTEKTLLKAALRGGLDQWVLGLALSQYSDTSANEDNSFLDHIR